VGLALAVPGLWYLVNVGINMGRLGGMAMMGVVLDPVWRGIVEPSVITTPLVTLLFIVALAAVYPASKAAWISPVQAIRHR
jgi:ABC-type lipoprotein release transport system permease subunit